MFLEAVESAQAGKYFKRWARRLRQLGFTREDAKVLSLGTFSTDEAGDILGVEAIVTLDRRVANHYAARRAELQRQLAAMCGKLPEPYCRAALPAMRSPADAMRQLAEVF